MVPDVDLITAGFSFASQFVTEVWQRTALFGAGFMVREILHYYLLNPLEKRLSRLESFIPTMFPLNTRTIVGYHFKQPVTYPGQAPSLHLGVDYGAQMGQPVHMPYFGVVVDVQVNRPDVGNMVIVRFDRDARYCRMAHLSSVVVRKGQILKEGDIIGGAGSTGWSTGVHLHLDLPSTINGTYWKDINNFVDPETYFPHTPFTLANAEYPIKTMTIEQVKKLDPMAIELIQRKNDPTVYVVVGSFIGAIGSEADLKECFGDDAWSKVQKLPENMHFKPLNEI